MLVYLGLVLVLSSVIVDEADSKVGAVRTQRVEGMEGEISFQLKVFDPVARKWQAEDTNYILFVGNKERDRRQKHRKKKRKKQIAVKTNKTAKSGEGWKPRDGGEKDAEGEGGVEACAYLYPDQSHINTLLSAITNRLTKLFVRLTKMLHGRHTAAGPAMKTRFRIVGKRDLFFERIFFNMTDDFRQAVERTRLRAGGAEQRDPCAHQDTIRALWVSLLDSSEACLGRAALACIDEYQRAFRTTDGERDVGRESESDGDSGGENRAKAGVGGGGVGKMAEARAARLVRRELRHVRNQQLQALCKKFQLCFRNLQRPSESKHKNKTKTTPHLSPLSHTTDTQRQL